MYRQLDERNMSKRDASNRGTCGSFVLFLALLFAWQSMMANGAAFADLHSTGDIISASMPTLLSDPSIVSPSIDSGAAGEHRVKRAARDFERRVVYNKKEATREVTITDTYRHAPSSSKNRAISKFKPKLKAMVQIDASSDEVEEIKGQRNSPNVQKTDKKLDSAFADSNEDEKQVEVHQSSAESDFSKFDVDGFLTGSGDQQSAEIRPASQAGSEEHPSNEGPAEVQKMISGSSEVNSEGFRQGSTIITQSSSDQRISNGSTTASNPKEYPWPASTESNINPDKSKGSDGSDEITVGIFHDLGFAKAEVGGSEDSSSSTGESVKTPKKTNGNKKGSSNTTSNSDSEESIMIKAFSGTESEERIPSTKDSVSRTVKIQATSKTKPSTKKTTESESDESILSALFGEESKENNQFTKKKETTIKGINSEASGSPKPSKKAAKTRTKSKSSRRGSNKKEMEESLLLKALFDGSDNEDISEDSTRSIKKKGSFSRTKASQIKSKTKKTKVRQRSKKKSDAISEEKQEKRKQKQSKPLGDSKETASTKNKGKSKTKSKSRRKSTRQESKDDPSGFRDNSREESGLNKHTFGIKSSGVKSSGNLPTRLRKGKISDNDDSNEDVSSNGERVLLSREKSLKKHSKIRQSKSKDDSLESTTESESREAIQKPPRNPGRKGLFDPPVSDELSEDVDSSRSSDEFSKNKDSTSTEASSQDNQNEDETKQSRRLKKKTSKRECRSDDSSCEKKLHENGSTSAEEDFTRISLEDDQSSGEDTEESSRRKNKVNTAGSKPKRKNKAGQHSSSEDSLEEASLLEELSSLMRTSKKHDAEESSEETSSTKKIKAAGIKSKTKKGRNTQASEEDLLSKEDSSAETINRDHVRSSEKGSDESDSSRSKVKGVGSKSKKNKEESNSNLENSQDSSFSKETSSTEQLVSSNSDQHSEEESRKTSQVKPPGSKLKNKKSSQASFAASEESSDEISLEQVRKSIKRTKTRSKKLPSIFSVNKGASASEEALVDELGHGKATKNDEEDVSPGRDDDDESQEPPNSRNFAEARKTAGNRRKQPDLSFSVENSSSLEDESFLESTIREISEEDSSDEEASAETKKSRNRERWRALMDHLKKSQRTDRKGQKDSADDSDSMERRAVTQRGNFKFSFLPQPSASTFPNLGSSDKSSEETKTPSHQPVDLGSSLLKLQGMLKAISRSSAETSKSVEKSSEGVAIDHMASLRETLLKLSNPQNSDSEEDKKTPPIFQRPGGDSSEEKQPASQLPIIRQTSKKYSKAPSPTFPAPYDLKPSSISTIATSNSEEKPPKLPSGRPSVVKVLQTHASYFTNGDQYSRGIPIFTTDKESLAGVGWQAFSEHLKGISNPASASTYGDKPQSKEVPRYGGSSGAHGWHSMIDHLKQMSKKPALFLAGNGDSNDDSKESLSRLVKPETSSTGSNASTSNSPEITDAAKNNQGSTEDSNSAENRGFFGRPVQFHHQTISTTTSKPISYGSGNHGWIPITPSPVQSSYTVPYKKIPSPLGSSTYFDGAADFLAEWEPFETAFYGGSQAFPETPDSSPSKSYFHPYQTSPNLEHVFSSSEEVQQVLLRQHRNFPTVQTPGAVFGRAKNDGNVYRLNGRQSNLKIGGFPIDYENGTYRFASRRFGSKDKKIRVLRRRRNRRRGKPAVQVFHV